MKKLFASLLAATMVAGMAVSAFAYCGIDGNDYNVTAGGQEVENGIADKTADYSLTAAPLTKEGKTVADFTGGKLYFPILVSDDVAQDKTVAGDKYVYATKASEVEDIKAKVKATIGGQYVEKEAKIVRKDKMITGHEAVKVYCVEVKVADFADVTEKEIEFDVTLLNKGRKEVEVEDINITFGADADKLTAGVDVTDSKEFNKPVKFKNNELTLYIKSGAKAYQLDEAIGANGTEDVERIFLELADADASFEVAASSQDDLYLGYSTDANKAIVVANPDADINFLDFDANPTFDFTGTLKLTVEDADKTYFCYEVKDGKVTPVGKYNAEDECFEIRTRTLGSYALSDKELVNAKADEEKPADKPAEEKPADKVVGTGAIA